MEIRGKCVVPGITKGELIVSFEPISFLGDIDPKTGNIISIKNPLKNNSIADKIFAFPHGKGSTVGSYIMYQLRKNGKAPKAIINQEAEAIIAVGAIISDIPMINGIDINQLPHGARVEINAEKGIIKFL